MIFRSPHTSAPKLAYPPTVLLFIGLLLLSALRPAATQPKASHAIRLVTAKAVTPTLTILHNFNPNTENQPAGGLVQGPDGNLYGVTSNGNNTVFQIAPDGTETTLHNFSFSNGDTPDSGLLLLNGVLYGTCFEFGGSSLSDAGTVWALNISQAQKDSTTGFTVLHVFTGTDGAAPEEAKLLLGKDGDLYGTTSTGGAANLGTIFQIQPDASGGFVQADPANPGQYLFSGTFNRIYDFTGGSTDGANPQGGLIQLNDGFLYGTTHTGGADSDGVVYQIKPNSSGTFLGNIQMTLLHSFTGGIVFGTNGITSVGDGTGPEGNLIQATDGDLYGTTYSGGPGNVGTVFQIKPDSHSVFSANSPFGTIAALNNNTGADIPGGVIQATDGNLYGVTYSGDANGDYTSSVFQIMPDPSTGKFDAVADPLSYGTTFPDPFATLYGFLGRYAPRSLDSALIQGLDGRLYGESLFGGQLADGTDAGGTAFAVDAGLVRITSVTNGSGSTAITTLDTSLIIHGANFTGSPVVTVDGTAATITARDYSTADTKITVTPAKALTVGDNTVSVGGSLPFHFAVTQGHLPPPTISGVDYTPGATTLVIHGTGFLAGAIVSVGTPQGATLTHVSLNSAAQITVTLSQALPGGSHVITVTNPDSQNATYTLVVAPAPTINAFPNGVLYSLLGGAQGRLTINGANFAATPTVTVTGPDSTTASPGTPVVFFDSSSQVTATFPQPLATGIYALTLANPDTQNAGTLFAILGATGASYAVTNGTPNVTITGGGFLGDPQKTQVFLGTDTTGLPVAASAVTVVNSHTLSVALASALAPGSYPFTLANADGQTATTTLTVAAPPPTSLVLKVNNSGNTNAVVIVPNDGFSGSLSDLHINRPDPTTVYTNLSGLSASAIQAARSTVQSVSHPRLNPHAAGGYPVIFSVAANTDLGQSQTQILVAGSGFVAGSGTTGSTITLDGTSYPSVASFQNQILVNVTKGLDPSQKHYLTVQNPGGKASQNELVVPTVGQFLSASAGGAFVYSSTPSSYNVKLAETILTGPGVALGAYATSPPLSQPQSANVGGATHLIGPNGAKVVSNDGGSIISQDGGNVVSNDGGSVVSNDGGSIVAAGAGNAVPVPAAVVSNDGGSVVSNDGGSLISQDGSSLISQDGSSLTGGDVLQGGGGAAPGVRPAAAPAVTSKAAAGPGYMDLSLFVSSVNTQKTLGLLTIRYTPGQPDVILYQDPSVTLTPIKGTPVPMAAPAAVRVTLGAFRSEHGRHGQLSQLVTLTNPTGFIVPGPLGVALANLPTGVSVMGAAGATVPASASGLAAGASMQMRVYFNAPGRPGFADTAQAVAMP